jgi:hypothetical protein
MAIPPLSSSVAEVVEIAAADGMAAGIGRRQAVRAMVDRAMVDRAMVDRATVVLADHPAILRVGAGRRLLVPATVPQVVPDGQVSPEGRRLAAQAMVAMAMPDRAARRRVACVTVIRGVPCRRDFRRRGRQQAMRVCPVEGASGIFRAGVASRITFRASTDTERECPFKLLLNGPVRRNITRVQVAGYVDRVD